MNPRLTIGMATYDDFDGVYFSIQHIRLMWPHYKDVIEFVIVDNNPGGEHSRLLQGLVNSIYSTGQAVKYIEMAEPQGTSPSRERIIQEASGEYVLVMDCHVLLQSYFLEALFHHYKFNQDTNDIITGPLLYDRLEPGSWATHYGNVWRAEMWGIWEAAWISPDGQLFSVAEDPTTKTLVAVEVSMDRHRMDVGLPEGTPWPGHEQILRKHGFTMYGEREDHPRSIEIPGQGLGLFSFRKAAWPGFHPDARGFGGEELWIHEKFRRNGGKALCFKDLGWLHRFGRPGGFKYPGVTKGRKMRNYVLEFQQLGMDLTPIYHHFVEELGVSPLEWDALLKDPVNWQDSQGAPGCNSCAEKARQRQLAQQQAANKPAEASTQRIEHLTDIEDVFKATRGIERDLNQHMDTLREYAEKCETVTEFTERRDSTVALIAARPKKVFSYSTEFDSLANTAKEVTKDTTEVIYNGKINTREITTIEPTDLLFLDTEHTAERASAELAQFSPFVNKYIIFHDTSIYGTKGTNGDKGLLHAISTFCRENPDWRVAYHTLVQYGLTILSKVPEERPPLPSIGKRLWNFGKALLEHVATPDRAASEELVEQRLNVCSLCPHRTNTECSVCGCVVNIKATWKDQDCPLALWPTPKEVEDAQEVSSNE